MLRIEISIVVILKQPPRSGRFLIPDSRQNSNSQRDFSIQNCLRIADKQETTPTKCFGHAHKMLGLRPCISLGLNLHREDVSQYTRKHKLLFVIQTAKYTSCIPVLQNFTHPKIISRLRSRATKQIVTMIFY